MFEYKKYVYPLKTIHKISSVYINIKIELRNHSKEYLHDEEILCQHQMSIYQHII